MEFRAASIDWMDRVSILICQRDFSTNQISHVARPLELVMQPHNPGSFIERGSLELAMPEAIGLMNALWQAGIRPSDFKNPSGEINRMEAHLADMRRLVFVTDGEQGPQEDKT